MGNFFSNSEPEITRTVYHVETRGSSTPRPELPSYYGGNQNDQFVNYRPQVVEQPRVPTRERKLPRAELIVRKSTLLFEHLDEQFFEYYAKYSSVSTGYTLVSLPLDCSEAQPMLRKFRKSNKNNFTVVKLLRIENPYLWSCYQLKKEEIEERYNVATEEEWYFHGTKVSNVDSICNNNLDWRLHGAAKGHRFGQGVSLSPISYYSSFSCDNKSFKKEMLVVKVLVTGQCVGNESMIVPSSNGVIDTSTKQNGHVIVKYDDNAFYPAYKIVFNDRF